MVALEPLELAVLVRIQTSQKIDYEQDGCGNIGGWKKRADAFKFLKSAA